MYTSETISPRKTTLSKATPLIWYGTSTFSIFVIYIVYIEFLQNHNPFLFLLGLLISLLLLLFFQEIIINKYLRMFPYWSVVLILGILLGFLWAILFIGSLFYLVLQSGIVSMGLASTIGKNPSLILSIIAIPLTTSVIFVIFTYGIWHYVVKPIHNSEKLSDKYKLLFAAIVANVVSVFSALSVTIVLAILLGNNAVFAFIIGAFIFSYMTYSAFKEIYLENVFFGTFEIKEESQLLG